MRISLFYHAQILFIWGRCSERDKRVEGGGNLSLDFLLVLFLFLEGFAFSGEASNLTVLVICAVGVER